MKVKLLDQTHPDYRGETLARYRALYDGGDSFRARAASFIPQRPAETPATHAERLSSSTYTNDCAPLIDAIPAHLFSTPIQATGWPSEWWEKWEADVDRLRHDLTAFVGDRLRDALVEGVAYVRVDLPRRLVDADSRGTEEALGYLDAYLVPYRAEQAIWWTEDAHGRLASIVFRDSREVMTFGSERKTLKRWTYLDSTVIRVFEAPDDAKPEDEADETLKVEHGFGRVPVVRLPLHASHHAMRVLHDPAVALLRARNAQTWALEKTAYAVPVFFTDLMPEDLATGAGRWIKLQPNDKMEWTEPSGASDASLAADIVAKRDDLYRALRSLFQSSHSDSLQQQSGESKSQDWRAFEVFLEGLRRLTVSFVDEIIDVVGAARKEATDEVEVTGLDGWGSEDPTGWIANVVIAEPWLRHSDRAQREVVHRVVDALLHDLDPAVRAEITEQVEAADLDDADPVPFAVPGTPPRR